MSKSVVTLSQVASWNASLRNPYRTRWATLQGRYFRVMATTLNGMWDIDEVTREGEYVDFIGVVFTLAKARQSIISHIQ